MTDLEEMTDVADEGGYVNNIPEIIERWALEDVAIAYSAPFNKPIEYYLLKAEQSVPERVYPRVWMADAVNYLIDSYKYRRYQENIKEDFDLQRAEYDAFMDGFEWMYVALNPGRLKSKTMLERGW